MKWKLFEGETLVNTIEAQEDFCIAYCQEMGYTYEAIVEEPDPAAVTEEKVRALSEACHGYIVGGIDVEGAHYSLSLEDQVNLMNLQAMVNAGAQGVPYHADGESCRMYTAEEFSAIAEKATTWKLFHESYFNSLRGYVYSLDAPAEVEAVTYGMEVPEEYQTDVLKALIAENPDTDFFPER